MTCPVRVKQLTVRQGSRMGLYNSSSLWMMAAIWEVAWFKGKCEEATLGDGIKGRTYCNVEVDSSHK